MGHALPLRALMTTPHPESPLSLTAQQAAWATTQLANALADNKGRFKELAAFPGTLAATQAAVFVIGTRKRTSYERAMAGETADSFNWIGNDPAQAAAEATLNRLMIGACDIDMLPQELLSTEGAHPDDVESQDDAYVDDLFPETLVPSP